MNSEEIIGWGSLVFQCLRYGVSVLGGGWAVCYGLRGLLRMFGG